MLDQLHALPDKPRLLYWINKTGAIKVLQAIGKIPK
jgi:hypothetical protein